MVFRPMDAGCGGVDGDDGETECAAPVAAVGLYLASTGTVWQSFACDTHARQLIAPREMRARDRDVLHRREELAKDPRIGRRYAGERGGPLARGAAAASLVREAIEWGRRNPFYLPHAGHSATDPNHGIEVGRLTVQELADELGVGPGDVEVLLSWLDPDSGGLHPDGKLRNEYAAAVRDQIDHFCERSVPDYWWPGNDPDAGKGATKMR